MHCKIVIDFGKSCLAQNSLLRYLSMNLAEQEAFEQLQQAADKSDAQDQLSGWVVRTGRQGVYYLHEGISLSFQTLGAARVAVHALKHHVLDSVIGTGHENIEDDDDEDGERTVAAVLMG